MALVGCATTADRLAASGLVDSSTCRYCGAMKESLHHFVDECPSLPDELQQPASVFAFGPNFRTLGVVEMDFDKVKEKLLVSQLRIGPVLCNLQVTFGRMAPRSSAIIHG